MLAKLYSAGIYGIEGFLITVECNVTKDLPHFDIVGLPDASVKEARERIRSAIESSGYFFGDPAITINLAPADLKKSGSAYDLPMTISILCGMGITHTDEDMCFFGEMALSGETKPIRGALSMTLAAREAGKKRIFVSAANAAEASAVDGVSVYGISSLKQLLDFLNGNTVLQPEIFDRQIFERQLVNYGIDFSDVKGQQTVKRALEISAAGGHNLLMIGPPGSGKSMLAHRLPTILPPLTFEEAIEITKIYSISGLLPDGQSLITQRPFRSPHHTASAVSLSGGGQVPMPGEISLAQYGVLFMDELPEYGKNVTEILRQPLENKEIAISRAAGRFVFPTDFMLICAMNPCRCGYFGSTVRKCTCSLTERKKYISKVSGPLLDRIDIEVEVPAVTYQDMNRTDTSESSESIRERVIKAREFAQQRYQQNGEKIRVNSDLSPMQIRKYCRLNDAASKILELAFERMGLSARGYDRILRVSRTIADLDGRADLNEGDVAQALQFRSLDRKYWGQ
ncbi:MAG: YifB family Mg chelatase-like AAA ATPase [Clostridiales bacterium]|nr:YifB family Mg chelatase-like AAA ATPase [Clostridiales bacterium]